MTTDNNDTRTINELINLTTYQGMSDEEIDTIISYKVNVEVMRRISQGEKTGITMRMETAIAQNEESCKKAQDALESILNRKLVLHSVGGDNE